MDDDGGAFAFEGADEGFTDAKLSDDFFGAECGIDAEGGGGSFDGFLIARSEGTKGVLIAVAELSEDDIGDVERVLGDKKDSDTFRPD